MRKRHLYFSQSVCPDVYAHHADNIVGKRRRPRQHGEDESCGAKSRITVVFNAIHQSCCPLA